MIFMDFFYFYFIYFQHAEFFGEKIKGHKKNSHQILQIAVFSVLQIAIHPRVCGEKRGMGKSTDWFLDSSPRMRGKDDDTDTYTACWRFIPAYAGKRQILVKSVVPIKIHPRVCGEKT